MSTRSTRSASQKQEKKVSRKDLIDQALNSSKRGKSTAINGSEPQKKIKTTQSKESMKSQPKSDNEAVKSLEKSKSEKKQPTKNQSKSPAKESAKEPAKDKNEVKIILKGKIPVDPYAQKNTKVLVHNGVTYASTLNQSNVQHNNNKFYILQVLESQTNPNNFYFFTRWGRVGVVGQMMNAGPTTRDKAIRDYNSKLNAKSKGGEYRIVEMNYEQNTKQDKKLQKKQTNETQKQDVQSTLHPKVQQLIRLIFDMKMMNNQMKEIGYDADKMPLGKLAKSSIMKGYQALKKLMEQVKGKKRKDVIATLSNDFYSYIPHDFGFKNMSLFILDTQHKIKGKLEMLQSLEDIQIFTKLLDEGKIANDINQLDSNYLKLNTQISPLDQSTEDYKIIKKYVENTHASSHKNYQLVIQQVYTLKKDVQNSRYRSDISNKQLLWHGSRLTNYVGILSQGLRIAPPEAPVTGYMFGKGVYFADMVSKSANYCFTNPTNNTGLMLLCEVALGNQNEKLGADYYANLLPDGKHSTKGCGKTAPKGGENFKDFWVPNGQGQLTNLPYSSLLYNEFIVYDVAQIKCKYLLKMKFVY